MSTSPIVLLIEVRIVGVEVALGSFLATLISDEYFQLLHSHLLEVNYLLSFSVDPIVSIKLFLQLDDCFIPFIES
jgi:hypothetical protein